MFFSNKLLFIFKKIQSENFFSENTWTSWRFKGFTLSVSWGRIKYKIKCFSCSSSFSPTKVSRTEFFPANSLPSPRVFFHSVSKRAKLRKKSWREKEVKEPFRQSHKNQKRSIAWDISLPAKLSGMRRKRVEWNTYRHRILSQLRLLSHPMPLPLRKTLDEIIKMWRKSQIKNTNTSKYSPSEAIIRQRCSIGVRTRQRQLKKSKLSKRKKRETSPRKSRGKGTHFFFHFILSISLQPTRTLLPSAKHRGITRRRKTWNKKM